MSATVRAARCAAVSGIVRVRPWAQGICIALAVVGYSLWIGSAGGSALAGEDDTAAPASGDLSGTYVCEQFRLELAKAGDGSYEGFRTPLERAAVGGTLSASAKVVERGLDRIVLSGDFARFKETFPFQATYQGATLRVSSIFSEYRLMRIPRPVDHREFAGTGFGGRPIRLVLEKEPAEDRPGAATLLVDEVVKHAVSFNRHNERITGTITMDDRKLDFSGRLRGLLLTLEIGPESYALATVGPSAINSDGLRTWFVNSASYDAAAQQLVLKIFTKAVLTDSEREQADFRFALLSKDGVRSAGQLSATDLPTPRPAAKPAAAARPNQPPARLAYRAQLVVPAEPSLLERSSVIKLEQAPAVRWPLAPR